MGIAIPFRSTSKAEPLGHTIKPLRIPIRACIIFSFDVAQCCETIANERSHVEIATPSPEARHDVARNSSFISNLPSSQRVKSGGSIVSAGALALTVPALLLSNARRNEVPRTVSQKGPMAFFLLRSCALAVNSA